MFCKGSRLPLNKITYPLCQGFQTSQLSGVVSAPDVTPQLNVLTSPVSGKHIAKSAKPSCISKAKKPPKTIPQNLASTALQEVSWLFGRFDTEQTILGVVCQI